MKKRLLICGGSGFIGSNVIRLLHDKYDIHTTFHKSYIKYTKHNVPMYITDLTDKVELNNLFNVVQPDIVIQAAAVTSNAKDILERPYLHVTENMVMNSRLFEQCFKNKIQHCIFLSCSTMYENSPIPQNENATYLDSKSPYFGVANMKVACENMCEFYAGLGDTKFTAIRHSNIFGPYDKFDLNKCHLVPAMIRKTIEQDPIEVFGTKENQAQRDILYVDDLINFIDLCLEKQTNKYELLNCGSGTTLSIEQIINTIQSILGTNKQIIFNNQPSISTCTLLDYTKAKLLLGWTPTTTLIDGLKQTIEYYKTLNV